MQISSLEIHSMQNKGAILMKQAFEIMLTENIQRRSMDPVEEAEALENMYEFGWGGVSELGRKIGKSEEYVSHRIQTPKTSGGGKEANSSKQIKS